MPSSSHSDPEPLVRFDRFMEEALYGTRGYYTSPRQILGNRGDFTTTPKLDTTLAARLALWIKDRWQHYGRALPVIELGPGDGTLAADIRKQLGWLARRKLQQHFVEISPHLRERQQEKNRGTWHRHLREALGSLDGEALIYSNEFFDAFPVRIFNSQLEELFLDQQKAEHWLPSSDLPDSLLFQERPSRFEVPESIAQWFQTDLSQLKRGEMLAIDYGGEADEIYHRRPLGTLRAYFQHQRYLPPEAYQNTGYQDLTFDVHFPDLIRWGEQIGLRKSCYQTQEAFLAKPTSEADQAFKVLVLTTT